MRREAKKRIMAFAIVLTFTLSSIAFVVTGLTGSAAEREFKPLQGYVFDGEIDPYTESVYVQNGFTFLKYYYVSQAPDYLNDMPDSFSTSAGQVQMFVVRIKGAEDYATVSNINGLKDIRNISLQNIAEELCDALVVLPPECSLILVERAQAEKNASG